MTLPIPVLEPNPLAPFPDPRSALRQPDGLLAVGGDLAVERLLNAYASGIFPWFSEGQPILWWSPDPRTVFRTDRVRLSSRFRRSLRNCNWRIRADTAFPEVLHACANVKRQGQHGTWITDAMQSAYLNLHHAGHAHSIEVFDNGILVGGLYGVAIGRMFFGESMFSARSGGSKVALAALAHRLAEWHWPLIDAQVENDHLLSLGAESWSRTRFLEVTSDLCKQDCLTSGQWTARFGEMDARTLAWQRQP